MTRYRIFPSAHLCITLQIWCLSKSDILHSSFIITQIFDILQASGICSHRLQPTAASNQIQQRRNIKMISAHTATWFFKPTRDHFIAGISVLKTGVFLPLQLGKFIQVSVVADNFIDCLHHVPTAPARLSKGLLSETNSHSPDRGMIILSSVGDDIPTHYYTQYTQ